MAAALGEQAGTREPRVRGHRSRGATVPPLVRRRATAAAGNGRADVGCCGVAPAAFRRWSGAPTLPRLAADAVRTDPQFRLALQRVAVSAPPGHRGGGRAELTSAAAASLPSPSAAGAPRRTAAWPRTRCASHVLVATGKRCDGAARASPPSHRGGGNPRLLPRRSHRC